MFYANQYANIKKTNYIMLQKFYVYCVVYHACWDECASMKLKSVMIDNGGVVGSIVLLSKLKTYMTVILCTDKQ